MLAAGRAEENEFAFIPSKLSKDGRHCRIVLSIVWTWLREILIEYDEVTHSRHIEQRLQLHASSDLMDPQ